MTTIDTADIYGHYTVEKLLGDAMALAPGLRDRLQIITKCGILLPCDARPEYSLKAYDTSARHIADSARRSLAAMRCGHIDLLMIHRPSPLMDPSDVAAAFRTLHREGLVTHFGVSNFTPLQFDLLQSRLDDTAGDGEPRIVLQTNQVEFSAVNPGTATDGTLEHLMLHRCAPMAWSPLGGASLFTRDTEQAKRMRGAMEAAAAALADVREGGGSDGSGASAEDDDAGAGSSADTGDAGANAGAIPIDVLALAWVMKHPSGVIPVIGATTTARVDAAVAAVDVAARMTRDQWFAVLEASRGHEVA